MRFSVSTNPFSLGGHFAREAAGCLFKGGGSMSTATTDSSVKTSNTNIDRSVASGTGAFTATEGSTINAQIESVDAETTKAAIEGANKTATAVTGLAVASNTDIAKAAITASGDAQRSTLDFTDKVIEKTAGAFATAQAGDSGKIQDTMSKVITTTVIAGTLVGGAYLISRAPTK